MALSMDTYVSFLLYCLLIYLSTSNIANTYFFKDFYVIKFNLFAVLNVS